ncbi:YhdP family protein [Pseudoxanthomonas sp. J31]|uniref:YhdP family protein n=1 Tax=Pseudoxanthomonas sp. J31 TaxID=935851 RepID=UPI0003FF59FC|nr:YhdP family protein [Pseudoxanthomonas sp. J31]
MTTVLSRHRLRRVRRWAGYLAAVLLIAVALAVGTTSQLLPLAERHPDKVAAWLSEKAGRPVQFDQVRTRWTRRGPLLHLDGLRIGGGADGGGVQVGQAEVLVSLYAGLLPGRSFTELRLRGPALALRREDDGRWAIRGLPLADGAPQADPLQYLEGLGELQVIGGRLDVEAPQLGLQLRIPRIDLRLRVDGARVRAGARSWIDPQAEPLALALEFERSRGDGRAWAQLDAADLAAWAPLLGQAGITPQAGSGKVQAWAELRGRRVVLATSQFELRGVELAGAPLEGLGRPLQQLAGLSGQLTWRLVAGGWRLDAPHLHLEMPGGAQRLDGLVLAGGQQYALRVDEVELGPLLALAALSDRLPPERRAWLLEAAPHARLAALELAGERGGALRLQGRLEGLGFAPVGRAPGLEGLSGSFEGDAQAIHLALDPATPLRLDWPGGFGVAHEVRLDGHLLAWREGPGWQVATPDLAIRASDYGARLRGGLHFQGDGTRPWMDVAAELDDAAVPAAKKFWLRQSMPPAAVQWLDMALEDGVVRDGRALVAGDLDDWPFVHDNGLFDARGRIEGGRFRFQAEWPALESTQAEVAFVGNGFQVRGSGELGGVPVERFEAGIADYGDAPLLVRASARADAGRFVELLRASPLYEAQAETLDNLQASGPARASFALNLPLKHDQPGRLSGSVELAGTRLVEKRWNLAFDGVRGEVRYDGNGFTAGDLAVAYEGQPGRLSLRAGRGHVQDPAQAFEAELAAPMDASRLLARAPELDWMRPYVHGRSAWILGLAVPANAPAGTPAARLRLDSDLAGTTLDFPAPLAKPAPATLPTRVQLGLPFGSGPIDLAFGQRLALRARQHNGATGVMVTLGSAVVAGEPPASGMAIGGHTAELDALEWIGLARGGGGDGLPLRRVDVLAQQLYLLGGQFAQTRLQLEPRAGMLAVEVDGPALAGHLQVPDAAGEPVQGRFARLHWQPVARAQAEAPAAAAAQTTPAADPGPTAAGAATPAAASVAAAGNPAADLPAAPEPTAPESFDPAAVPPLAIEVEDLRYRGARLGRASLRTTPVADGMRLERLQLRADWQQADISGEWTGRGADARTRLQVDVRSEDMGRLVSALGYADFLARGEGTLRLQAGWPGPPDGFSLGALEGNLRIDVRNGQLLEVEPGAGRVLGLLSVAQLPRRLMLDFRDFFFRGLAFNRLEGQVQVGGGHAATPDMLIDGPAAEIRIRGRTDLVAQQFDQTIDVQPKSGNLLTVVGAVAGGPMGAAVGAAANAVLGRPLGGIAARTYHVSGPWKEPRVEVVEREPAAGAPAGGAPTPPEPAAPGTAGPDLAR